MSHPQSPSRRAACAALFFCGAVFCGTAAAQLGSPEIDERLKNGPPLVSANFVIPYPPGFPIMVPGQVIEADTIGFMRKLDVKEIHGYDNSVGLKLIAPSALAEQKTVLKPAAKAAKGKHEASAEREG